MHLWTEYEGNTVAGFKLGRLSRSEGRSAFFLTSTTDNKPALLRLTETHFDEGELTTRWQAAAKVSHPNLQRIDGAGQTTFEGTALAWCLLEATDASLSDILPERALTQEEALQVTEAVAGALHALHAANLIHEHVDPTNVFAVGETVKLRSDCVRECAGDFEADTPEAREELRRRDVHDLGTLLLRCLSAPGQDPETAQLPSPFDRIVRRARNGSVDAAGIVAEVEALKPAPPRQPVPAAENATTYNGAPLAGTARPSSAGNGTPAYGSPGQGIPAAARNRTPEPARNASPYNRNAGTAVEDEDTGTIYAGLPRPGAAPLPAAAQATSPSAVRSTTAATAAASSYAAVPSPPMHASSSAASSVHEQPLSGRVRTGSSTHTGSNPFAGEPETLPARLLQHKGWLAGGAVAALLGIVLWSTTGTAHHSSAPAATADDSAAQTSPEPAVIAVEQPSVRPQSRAGRAQSSPAAAPSRTAVQAALPNSGGPSGWRVIAYTYNYEKQAQAKVEKLQRRYASLHPQVFSPTGHAPYLVALGGPSDAETATALRNRARRSGLPRDTFARNF